jgi:hypothetical protein
LTQVMSVLVVELQKDRGIFGTPRL